MAAEREAQTEYKAHERGYSMFTALMKWGTIASFVAAAIVVLIIAS